MVWPAVALALLVGSASAAPNVQARETIAAIQIQGNTATPDDEVRRLAGVDVGTAFEATTLADAAARLRATRRFERVEVLKRFASIADPSQIVVVIVVDEGAVRIEMTGDPDRPTRVVRSRWPHVLFLPVLDGEDGYGLTYGARLALADRIGPNSRISFPLTWGGRKQAAAELDKTLAHGPFSRVVAGGSISRRTNPFFEQDDTREGLSVRGERELVRAVRAGATAGVERVSFGEAHDRLAQAGVDLVVDTRLDPALPRNAVFARVAWDRFSVRGGSGDAAPQRHSVSRTELDARGYVGLAGQNVLGLRALRVAGSGPMPLYLQPLLGGMSNLRGFRAGTAAGDMLVAFSAELIVPLTSPLDVGKIGVSLFTDRGTAYSHPQRLADQTMREGYGGSVWFTAAFLRLNLAVAHGHGSSTRVHAGGTVSF
jgi:outer membrane protein assembly factor BamA